MLDISVTIQGDKVIIEGLQKFATEIPEVIQAGIKEAVVGITQNAKYFLHAEGAAGTSKYVTSKKTGRKYLKWTKRQTPISPGGYPVPIRSGLLGRSLMWLFPGESKSWGEFSDIPSRKVVKGGSMKAGTFEGIVFNRAPYAHVISAGTRTSVKYGPRPFLIDALKRFNQGDRLIKIMKENIEKAKRKYGL